MKTDPQKIRNISKILYSLFWVLYLLELAAVTLCALFLVVQFFLPNQLFTVESGRFGLTLDNLLYFNLDSALQTGPVNLKPILQAVLPFGIILILMLAVGTRQLMQILKSVVQENPFDGNNPDRLRRIGLTMIAASFVASLARLIAARSIIKILDLSQISTNYSVDTGLVIAGLLVLILSGIFRYGTYLKNEYDATL